MVRKIKRAIGIGLIVVGAMSSLMFCDIFANSILAIIVTTIALWFRHKRQDLPKPVELKIERYQGAKKTTCFCDGFAYIVCSIDTSVLHCAVGLNGLRECSGFLKVGVDATLVDMLWHTNHEAYDEIYKMEKFRQKCLYLCRETDDKREDIFCEMAIRNPEIATAVDYVSLREEMEMEIRLRLNKSEKTEDLHGEVGRGLNDFVEEAETTADILSLIAADNGSSIVRSLVLDDGDQSLRANLPRYGLKIKGLHQSVCGTHASALALRRRIQRRTRRQALRK